MTILFRKAVAAAFASILALASAVSAQTTGTVTHDGVAMPVKAAVAQ